MTPFFIWELCRKTRERRCALVHSFDTNGHVPVAIGVDLLGFQAETSLTADQKQAISRRFAILIAAAGCAQLSQWGIG
jgi:hypothetical protein